MYKIISKDRVIDVVEYPKYTRFLASGHIALTDKTSAHGIVGSDGETIYSFLPDTKFTLVTAVKIAADEFERLKGLLDSGEEVPADESLLANTKRTKLAALSDICRDNITAGFTIELSEGQKENFRLTAEDQLNLIQIESQLQNGETNFVYHSTNQPCRIYSKADMNKVVKAFRKHVLYHTTYFNTVKQYINALDDVEKITLFSYGDDVSDTIRNPMLKQILRNGGA